MTQPGGTVNLMEASLGVEADGRTAGITAGTIAGTIAGTTAGTTTFSLTK